MSPPLPLELSPPPLLLPGPLLLVAATGGRGANVLPLQPKAG